MNMRWLFFIFTVSGFAGLIYESIWTHYLKLFLGHAAYAQTLVLAIFMGGMAIGSFLASRLSPRIANPLAGYAVAEGAVGLYALVFHHLFVGMQTFAYTSLLPALAAPSPIAASKWGLSALLILPPSVLLGMTFPLMSAAFLRLFPERQGSSVAMLYFTNSIGAVLGVLASGFVLIRVLGLPGTVRLAGTVNLLLAVSVWYLSRRTAFPLEREGERAAASGAALPAGTMLLLATSFLTGAASFVYEIGWIRMLSMVLGSSTHAFELMLSAFILGLACGGLWIKRRIDAIGSPVRFLAVVQLLMGLLALATLPLYGSTFGVMQWALGFLPKTEQGYLLFNLVSHSIASAVMLPATFCAGMTLPLITAILIRRGWGERSVGAVYAANTVGAIAGVLFAVHVGLPFLGLKGLLMAGGGLDMLVGVLLAAACAEQRQWRLAASLAVVGLVAVTAVKAGVTLDAYKMASGVYRTGKMLSPDSSLIRYHRDGKTSTVSVEVSAYGITSVRNNGKNDSAIGIMADDVITADEATTILLGTLPFAYRPDAKSAVNIGLGTGLTSHTLLGSPRIRSVETIEIERSMVEAAGYFAGRNERVFRDPRSSIRIDDAKSFMASRNRRYDIIVSEPSNPWVSGVAGLFTEEFYRLVADHLTDDGILVQWLQLYEIDPGLVVSVMKALSGSFADYALYATNTNDMIVVATRHGRLGSPQNAPWEAPALRGALERIGIRGPQDLRLRQVGTKAVLGPFIAAYPVRANSDFYPVLDQNAAKARYLGNDALLFTNGEEGAFPLFRLLGPPGVMRASAVNPILTATYFEEMHRAARADALREFFLRGVFPPEQEQGLVLDDNDHTKARLLRSCAAAAPAERTPLLFSQAAALVPYLQPGELADVWNWLENEGCRGRLTQAEELSLTLFRDLGERRFSRAGVTARRLLASAPPLDRQQTGYLLAAAMTGLLADGDRSGALALWERYRGQVYGREATPMVLRLLEAHCRADKSDLFEREGSR